MKFADGPETSATIQIAAPCETVWPLLIDPATSPRFSDELQRCEWGAHPSGSPGLGSILIGHNKRDDLGEWTTESVITTFDEPVALAWTVGNVDQPVAVWSYRVQPNDEGCQVTYTVRIGPGQSGLTNAIASMPEIEEQIVEGRLVMLNTNMVRVLEGIRDIVAD